MESPRQHPPDGTSARTSPEPQASFVADGLFQRFQQIQAILAAVIGAGGVVALYQRSRHLSSRSFSWLAPSAQATRSGMDLEELRSLVAQQTDEAAAAGAALLLKTFHDLLAGLVGQSLMNQLLGAPPSLGPSTNTHNTP